MQKKAVRWFLITVSIALLFLNATALICWSEYVLVSNPSDLNLRVAEQDGILLVVNGQDGILWFNDINLWKVEKKTETGFVNISNRIRPDNSLLLYNPYKPARSDYSYSFPIVLQINGMHLLEIEKKSGCSVPLPRDDLLGWVLVAALGLIGCWLFFKKNNRGLVAVFIIAALFLSWILSRPPIVP
ncbi:MAG: hypothetical protein HY917_02490 [Candidatus Diapherotrites archaeon]|nr:hypothetical protein [Candidatus Diapherotrites archaeon]